MLCGNLDGRGVWGKMDTCVCMAEFLCRSPEITTALVINWLSESESLVAQSCPTLCEPMDRSPQAPLSMELFRPRILA